ncbi:MAG: hypothetical protein DI498_13295 [Paracoccus denitrificans]|nr:MAG: hypothetical protein DI498_13295 [Paracoccus denitrificans]PZO83061.1 MAG: hypothetical protein DI633_13295 [Paracoccus denitrificans]
MTGAELAALRRRAGLSQSSLARKTGVSRQSISYWERQSAVDGSSAIPIRIAHELDAASSALILASQPLQRALPPRIKGPIELRQWRAIIQAIAGAEIAEAERPKCGARTHSGTACRSPGEDGRTRCRLHGGLSTGPKTELAANGSQRPKRDAGPRRVLIWMTRNSV